MWVIMEGNQSSSAPRFLARVTGWMAELPTETSKTEMGGAWMGDTRNSVWDMLSVGCLGEVSVRYPEGYGTLTSGAQAWKNGAGDVNLTVSRT